MDDNRSQQDVATPRDEATGEPGWKWWWRWGRRSLLLLFGTVVFYILLTGPLLWSYGRFDNPSWNRFVDLAMSPVVKLDVLSRLEEYEEFSAGFSRDSTGCYSGDIFASPQWLQPLTWYWGCYGDSHEIAYMLLKMKHLKNRAS